MLLISNKSLAVAEMGTENLFVNTTIFDRVVKSPSIPQTAADP